MQKQCAVSGQTFEITDDDLRFYEKMNLPVPTHAPRERWRRRMMWRNDRSFYKRKCDATGKSIVSMYPEDVPFPVYDHKAWWGDSWDGLDYGQDFDFTRPFFDQWQELFRNVPRMNLDVVNCENSDYCNFCGDDKDCYLDIAGESNQDCYFNLFTKYSKDCVDCTFVYNSELCYQSINCYNCYEVLFSMYLENCHACAFCFDLKGCSDCLFSSNLRQKQYYIFNKPHTKESYEKFLAELRLDSWSNLQRHRAKWLEVMQNAIHRDMVIINSENCTGNHIMNSKNTQWGFNVSHCEDSKYLFDVLEAKDCYDLNYSLYKPEASCELISTLNMTYSAFCMASHYCSDCFYVDSCNNSSHLFGCIGLHQKKYCILNKQYSEEEYEDLKARIVEHMRETGEFGEFFPGELSPFAYNETVAQEYLPLTNESCLKRGFRWKQEVHNSAEEILGEDVPDAVQDVPDDICERTLACEKTGKAFRIVKPELKFYRKMDLPLPRLSPDARHLERMNLRAPRMLFSGNCCACKKSLRTPLSPEKDERVFCEACYLKVLS